MASLPRCRTDDEHEIQGEVHCGQLARSESTASVIKLNELTSLHSFSYLWNYSYFILTFLRALLYLRSEGRVGDHSEKNLDIRKCQQLGTFDHAVMI